MLFDPATGSPPGRVGVDQENGVANVAGKRRASKVRSGGNHDLSFRSSHRLAQGYDKNVLNRTHVLRPAPLLSVTGESELTTESQEAL